MSELSLLVLCLLAISGVFVDAQNDGQNRPLRATTTRKPFSPSLGRYTTAAPKVNDGKYYPKDDGKYRPRDDGKYRPPKVITTKPPPPPPKQLPKGSGTSIGRNDFKILYLYNKEEKDGYHYIYETENGILAEEEGHIVDLPTGEGLRAKGFFEYTGDDGSLYRVDYVADDAGFVPQGAHLHPTPPHVVKLLEFLAKNAKK